jgi:leader peptidase (prepilin peptidase)/N-methyltransferase
VTGTHHFGLRAAIVTVAGLLVRFPRALFTEAAEQRPPRRLEWGLAAGLAVVGVAVFETTAAHSSFARLTLAFFAMILAAVVYADLSFLVIPDLYSAGLVGLALLAPWRLPLVDVLIGAAACGGLLAVLALAWRRFAAVEGLGFGDVKLAAAVGGLLGAQVGLMAISLSAAGAAILAYGVRLAKRNKDAIPLVPYGAALALAAGGLMAWSVL